MAAQKPLAAVAGCGLIVWERGAEEKMDERFI
jgi:hypothetical protein